MENKEFDFREFHISGFLMLFVQFLLLVPAGVVCFLLASPVLAVAGAVIVLVFLILSFGYMKLEPNEAKVMVFFGDYRGTFHKTGFYWVNPFYAKKRLSLRARNLDVPPIKVNDKTGNPVMAGQMLVWRLKDTYKAMFEIDAQTMAESATLSETTAEKAEVSALAGRMNAFEKFVRIQSDAALRQIVGQYAYDDNDDAADDITLRSGSDVINEQLEQKLNERLAMAGIEVIEARINYLAYASEIAAVMLRRQQASAIITAREKIVEGAVSMVKMALDKLSSDGVVELDEEKKAAMVSNLLVVLCADESAQPVVNTGTLNH